MMPCGTRRATTEDLDLHLKRVAIKTELRLRLFLLLWGIAVKAYAHLATELTGTYLTT